MDDSFILRIAFVCSLIGLASLFMLSSRIAGYSSSIILAEDGEQMMIQGKIVYSEQLGTVTRLKIDQATLIDAVVFDEIQDDCLNRTVTIIAERSSYKGRPELLVSRIE
jgi:hypothetical protein